MGQPCHLRLTPGAEPSPALLVDISESGARIESTLILDRSMPAEILWSPIPGSQELSLVGKIMWVTDSAFGMEFQGVDTHTKKLLQSLVRHQRGEVA